MSNFFDDLTSNFNIYEASEIAKEKEMNANRIDYLVHAVFEQNKHGRELLEIWKESLILTSTADDAMDSIAIGIREGMKRFIRGILLTIRRVENG